jgi:hypothetical protein
MFHASQVAEGLDVEAREPIPEALRRRVLVEAGHRCAIPTCRNPVTEIAHIVPYHEVQKHEYENLIALCPTCHARADRREIDRKSLKIYKRILQRLTDRYERFELLVLDELRLNRPVIMAGSMTLLIKNLLDEQLVTLNENIGGSRVEIQGIPSNVQVLLTLKGRTFIDEWINAHDSLTY